MWEVNSGQYEGQFWSILRSIFSNKVLNSVKQVLDSVKLSIYEVKTQSNGSVNLKYSINQPGTLKQACVLHP